MFKFTKDPLKQIILYNYLSNKLDDNMIILLLSYLGIYYKINLNIFHNSNTIITYYTPFVNLGLGSL